MAARINELFDEVKRVEMLNWPITSLDNPNENRKAWFKTM